MRIASLLHTAYNRDGAEFVVSTYQQLLNREPSEPEVAVRVGELARGTTKYEMMASIMSSSEAMALYEELPDGSVETTADKIRFIRQAEEAETFINMLYAEVLCRFAEEEEYADQLQALERGIYPSALIQAFLLSEELRMLLESDRTIINRRMLKIFMTSR